MGIRGSLPPRNALRRGRGLPRPSDNSGGVVTIRPGKRGILKKTRGNVKFSKK